MKADGADVIVGRTTVVGQTYGYGRDENLLHLAIEVPGIDIIPADMPCARGKPDHQWRVTEPVTTPIISPTCASR
jgi:hypothetical protein